MPGKACRISPISSSRSTKKQGRTTPQQHSPQLCRRSCKVHRVRRCEIVKMTLVYQHELPNVPGKRVKGVLVEYDPGGIRLATRIPNPPSSARPCLRGDPQSG